MEHKTIDLDTLKEVINMFNDSKIDILKMLNVYPNFSEISVCNEYKSFKIDDMGFIKGYYGYEHFTKDGLLIVEGREMVKVFTNFILE